MVVLCSIVTIFACSGDEPTIMPVVPEIPSQPTDSIPVDSSNIIPVDKTDSIPEDTHTTGLETDINGWDIDSNENEWIVI